MLDSLVPDTDKIQETVRITFLQRAVEENHDLRQSMFSILFEDPRLVPQGSLLLKSTMTCSGMQPINMISPILQGKKWQAFISQQVDSFDESDHGKLIHLMNLTMVLEKTAYVIKMRMIIPHTQFFILLSVFLSLKNLPRFFSLINLGECFLRLQRSLSFSTRRMLKWLTPNHTSTVATQHLNLLWVNPIQSPSKPTFMRMTILLIILILKILLKLWCMSA